MADFFRFIRHSSNRIFGSIRSKSSRKQSRENNNNNIKSSSKSQQQQRQRKSHSQGSTTTADRNKAKKIGSLEVVDNSQGERDRLSYYITNVCVHVSENKWDEIWQATIESRANHLIGLVFVNPNFARTYYVPSHGFRYYCDDFNEYGRVDHDALALMKNDQYEKCMQSMVRSDSCYVSMAICQPVELLDRYCSRCPCLVRLSLHYYFLDDSFVDYLARYLPNLVSVNFENCIGLSSVAYGNLGFLKNLINLNVSGCDISESSLLKIFENCRNLESLNVSNNCAITGYCFAHNVVKKLKRLNIKDCWRLASTRLVEMAQNGLPNLVELLCNSGINDDSMSMLASNCPNLIHLDISFEEFTYHDPAGFNLLTESGFMSIAKLRNLEALRLRHIGRLTNNSLTHITRSCNNLGQLTLNLRHRHKLSDSDALTGIAANCPRLTLFEAVHNHFISHNSINELSLAVNLQTLILRGNDLIKDEQIVLLIENCYQLRLLNLDGCPNIDEKTFCACIRHAQLMYNDQNGNRPNFVASLIQTAVDRSYLISYFDRFPPNLHIRVSDQRKNKVHYNEFDGKEILTHQLRETFFPFYWFDYN